MNTHNNWEQLRDFANEELKKHNAMLSVYEALDGTFDIDILYDLDFTAEPFDITKYQECETFASNYYENELADVITEAWHYACKKVSKI